MEMRFKLPTMARDGFSLNLESSTDLQNWLHLPATPQMLNPGSAPSGPTDIWKLDLGPVQPLRKLYRLRLPE
jgi:hypothetical protein